MARNPHETERASPPKKTHNHRSCHTQESGKRRSGKTRESQSNRQGNHSHGKRSCRRGRERTRPPHALTEHAARFRTSWARRKREPTSKNMGKHPNFQVPSQKPHRPRPKPRHNRHRTSRKSRRKQIPLPKTRSSPLGHGVDELRHGRNG